LIYLESPSTDPAFNLALEQFVFDEMDKSQNYFMLWQNDKAVIVGKNQNTFEEVNLRYVEEQGIRVVRRLSGGGAVYHDLGNLNFTFIVSGQNMEHMNLHVFCRPVIRVLRELGVEAQAGGRNDIIIGGRKISGNSQYIRGGRVMHHGTLLFDSDLDVVTACLNVPKDKVESKGIKSVRSRVTNIRDNLPENCRDMTLEQFKTLLKRAVGESVSETSGTSWQESVSETSGAPWQKSVSETPGAPWQESAFETSGITWKENVSEMSGAFWQENVPEMPGASRQKSVFNRESACSMEHHIFTAAELARVEEIRAARYGLWEWNYGRSPSYSIRKERSVENCGKILLSMDVRDGRIEALEFHGDYFGNRDTAELAALLKGCPVDRAALDACLAKIDVEQYFHRLTRGQLTDILAQ